MFVAPKAADIEIIAQPYGGFLYSRSLNGYVPINNTALFFLEILEKHNLDVDKTVNFLSAFYGVEEELILSDLQDLINNLQEFFYITEKPVFLTKGIRILFKREKELLKLVKASIDLTYRCNLNCLYCYANSNEDLILELDALGWEKILSSAYEKGLRALEITGGEPFLYSDLRKLLEFIHDKFIFEINTNGTLITEYWADVLSFLKPKAVQISLDSPTPEVHDRFRGKGSWKKAVRAIDLLKNKGVPVRISMTVYRENVQLIDEMLEFSKEIGCELIVQSAKPAGKAERLARSFFSKDPQDKSNSDYFFDPTMEVYCQTQLGYASISPNGQLKACNMRPEYFKRIGVYRSINEDLEWYLEWFELTKLGKLFSAINKESLTFKSQKRLIKKRLMIYPSCILEAYLKFLKS